MGRLLSYGDAISRVAVWVGGSMILLTALLICAEVILRKMAGISTGGADELSGYALAVGSSWAMGFALLRRAHVRVDAIYTRLSAGPRAWLDALGIVSMAVFASVLTFYCGVVLQDTLALQARSNTTLGTPLWIPQSLWLVGLILFTSISLLLAAATLLALLRHDHALIQRLVGSRTTDEELGAELDKAPSDRTGPPPC